jgi:hypothetical protein
LVPDPDPNADDYEHMSSGRPARFDRIEADSIPHQKAKTAP